MGDPEPATLAGGPKPATLCPSVRLRAGTNSLSPGKGRGAGFSPCPTAPSSVLAAGVRSLAQHLQCLTAWRVRTSHLPLCRGGEHSLCTPWGGSSRRSRVEGSQGQRCQPGLGARGPPFSWSPRYWHLCAPCRPARERSQAAAVIRRTQTFPSGCSSEE